MHTKEQRYLKAIKKEAKAFFFFVIALQIKTDLHFLSYIYMETMHKILKRFAESEKRQMLSTHKIELNILQNAEDALKALKKAKSDSFKRGDKLTKDGEKYAEQINKIKNNYANQIDQVRKTLLNKSDLQSAVSALKRIEQTAKDLGLKASEVPVYKKLSKELDGAEDLVQDLKDSINSKYNKFNAKIKF